MRRSNSALALGALWLSLSSCSLATGGLETARCVRDSDCDALNAEMGIGPEACEPLRCDIGLGRCTPQTVDLDGDGEAPVRCGGVDCNDQSPGIRPGAVEVCNGIDDDCDGQLDGPDEDDDRDGAADRCAGALARDCDDGDPLTYYDAPELCDGFDNDCLIDGFRRAGGDRQREPSEDLDEDEHAAIGALCSSEPPAGSTVTLLPIDDCDDARADRHPGATEICGTDDLDCDGIVANRAGAAAGTACNPVQMEAGAMGVCVRDAAGRLACWGDAAVGAITTLLRDMTPPGIEPAGVAAQVAVRNGAAGVRDFALGSTHACALDVRGEGRCWGGDWFRGVLGNGGARPTLGSTTQVLELADATAIAANALHTCALREGRVLCWGDNGEGQIGGEPGTVHVPREVPGVSGALRIGAGRAHTCAVIEGGAVWCWGAPYSGQLGNGIADLSMSRLPPAPALGIDDAVDVVTGASHSCVLDETGGVRCFGRNDHGQIGDGAGGVAGATVATPTAVLGPGGTGTLTGVVEIASGSDHVCARDAAGTAWCWGRNDAGQLGDGTTTSRSTPAPVAGLTDAVSLALGDRFSCAQRRDGRPVCWGANGQHQLGDGTTEDRPVPTPVQVITDFVELRSTTRGRCARRAIGTWVCDFDPQVEALGPLRDLAIGVDSTCAVDAEGALFCWGDNSQSQLGVPSTELAGSDAPMRVPDVPPMRRVVLPTDDSRVTETSGTPTTARALAIDEDGVLWAWGTQMGSSCVARGIFTRPRVLPDLPPMLDASIGQTMNGVVGQDGSVWLWGCGIDGDVYEAPQRIVFGRAAEIDIGHRFVCVRTLDGTVECFGENDRGQLGDDGGTRWTPAPVIGLRAVTQVDVGPATACAIVEGDAMRCWGDNGEELIGPPATVGDRVTVPTVVTGAASARAVTVLVNEICAIRDGTQVVCWGEAPYWTPPQGTTGWY